MMKNLVKLLKQNIIDSGEWVSNNILLQLWNTITRLLFTATTD